MPFHFHSNRLENHEIYKQKKKKWTKMDQFYFNLFIRFHLNFWMNSWNKIERKHVENCSLQE